jgi:hypothetical protein
MTHSLNALRISVAALLASLLIACGEKEQPAPPPPKPKPAAEAGEIPLPGAPVAKPAVPTVPAVAAPGLPDRPKVDPALKAAVERYFNESGRAPESWQDLIKKKLITSVPVDQTGTPMDFKKFLFDMR